MGTHGADHAVGTHVDGRLGGVRDAKLIAGVVADEEKGKNAGRLKNLSSGALVI